MTQTRSFDFRTLCIGFICLFGCLGAAAQTDSPLSRMARQNMHVFTYDGSFEGQGWQKVLEMAEKHKYFLIGEDHGLAEIPLFTKELISHIDYDLFVAEIDSITASVARHLAAAPASRIDAFHKENPSALSFFSATEEFELLTRLSKKGADVWGLDQASLFSTGIALRRLSALCKSKAAKELTTRLADLSDDLFKEAAESGNYDTLFIYSSKQIVFDHLKEVLAGESREATSILKDLEESWQIYNGINGAGYSTRIGGMKSKLLNYYLQQASEGAKSEKVLYKFGAYHVGKAESYAGLYDVGNLVSHLAHAEGKSSYHLMIVGKKGEQNTFLPTEGMKTAPFNMEDKKSDLHSLLPFARLVDESKWAFFDLTPVRQAYRKGELQITGRLLKATIMGYDGLVIIPEATPSTLPDSSGK